MASAAGKRGPVSWFWHRVVLGQKTPKTGPSVLRPGPRGWRGPGAGESVLVEPAAEWRGTTVQVCGLYPFGVGSGTPVIGVPLGRHLLSGATVCADPISWFQRARLIRNPSMFVLGLPGLGKSTLVRRILIGSAGYGAIPLVLGDIRPDYVDLIEELGGDVIPLGPGRGSLNVLDNSEVIEAAGRLRRAEAATKDPAEKARLVKLREQLLADSKGRRAALIEALVTIQRAGKPLEDREDSIISEALEMLDESGTAAPVIGDLLALIRKAPDRLRDVALDRGNMERYQQVTEMLEVALMGLTQSSRMGSGVFSRPTSKPMRRDRPVVFDLSGIQQSQDALRAAALLASWSTGFGQVAIASTLAEAGLEQRRHYIIAMDEIHQALRSGPGMVERYDQITRLNRGWGVGQIMITHTMKDLDSLATEEDRMKARGLVERSGMVVLGGLPAAEMPLLARVQRVSQAEQGLLMKWQEPPSWDPETGAESKPPGLGLFLIKVGSRPGIPFEVQLTSRERHVHDTNRLWKEQSRIGSIEEEAVS
jgi:hypothetical protein